jgi:hypothetical protein
MNRRLAAAAFWSVLAAAPFTPFIVVWLATGYASTALLYSALALAVVVGVIAGLRHLAASTLR